MHQMRQARCGHSRGRRMGKQAGCEAVAKAYLRRPHKVIAGRAARAVEIKIVRAISFHHFQRDIFAVTCGLSSILNIDQTIKRAFRKFTLVIIRMPCVATMAKC